MIQDSICTNLGFCALSIQLQALMSLGASASLKLTHPSVPHMHHSWQQHVYEQYLFLFVCVCVMLRKSSSALFSCKLPLAQPQPQQRSRSSAAAAAVSRSVSHSSGALALVLAPSDITVRSKKETQAAKRAAGITGSKRHHRLDWQGG